MTVPPGTAPGIMTGWRYARRSFLLCLVLWSFSSAFAQENQREQAAAIASAHPLATAAGHEILKRGGNAFDAAVAVAAALSVVEPYSSGLGGGGFYLLHRARDGYQVMVDGRETAPAGVTQEQYVGRDGKPLSGATTQGGRAAGIPGAPAALAHVAERYGVLPLAVSLAPAIRYAREGFAVDERYARMAELRERYLQAGTGTARIFLDGNRAPRVGWLLRQPELAGTLERLAKEGHNGFYTGPVAAAMVESANRAGGTWRGQDLLDYRVIERAPLRFRYRGATITTASLPSAGGIALMQCLRMLGERDPGDARTPESAHRVIEVLRRAFHDRARYLGDSDFVSIPLEHLLSRAYLAERAASINPDIATKSEALGPGPDVGGGPNTTHLSVVDAAGNRVAATLTINLLFGAGVVADGTGVLLNNEMDDFTVEEDVPNAFRLRGSQANAIAPGKRPLSSMTPTFVEDSKGVLVIGAPGGSRIVSQVLLATLDYLRSPSVNLAGIVGAPRYHHQWRPDVVEIEPAGFSPEWRVALESRGHRVQAVRRRWGNMQAVFQAKDTGGVQAASDPRGAEGGWY